MSQRVGAAILVSSGSVYALRGRVRGTGGETIAPWRRARRSTVASLCPYRYGWGEGPETCRRGPATCMGAVSDSGPKRRESARRAHETTEQVLKPLGRV